MNDHRKDDQPDMVIVHRPSNALLVVAGVALAVVLIAAATFGTIALINSSRISKNQDRLEAVEQTDTRLSRAAAYRLCARERLARAEIHVAYQPGTAQMLPPELRGQLLREPVLAKLLEAGEAQRRVSLRRVEKMLPIANCWPNFRGEKAIALPADEQRRFVSDYRALKKAPLLARPSR